jgi:hypothetical protein
VKKIPFGLLGAALGLSATAALAWPMGYRGYGYGKSTETHYFEAWDVDYQHEIGAYIEYCDGHSAGWGTIGVQSTYAWYDC